MRAWTGLNSQVFPFHPSYSGFNPLPSSYLRMNQRKSAKIPVLSPEYPAIPRYSTLLLSTHQPSTINHQPL
jgi:hypothetical protein